MNLRLLNRLFNLWCFLGAALGCDRASDGSQRFASAGIAGDDSSPNLAPDSSDQSVKNFKPLALTVNTIALPKEQSLSLVSESLETVTVVIQGGSFCWDRLDGEHVLKPGDVLLFNLNAKNCVLRVKKINVGSLGSFSALGDLDGLDTARTGQWMTFTSDKNQANVAQVKVLQSPFDNPNAQLSLSLSAVTNESVTMKTVPPECTFNPMHVAVVLDASGSMAGSKWTAARNGALDLAKKLRFRGANHDELDAVVFNTSLPNKAKLVSHLPDSIGRDDTSLLASALLREDAEGGTNIVKGFYKAFNAIKDKQGFKVLVILTDGQHNDARTDEFVPSRIRDDAIAHGVTVIPIGYGYSGTGTINPNCSRRNPILCSPPPREYWQDVGNVKGLATDPDNYINAWQNDADYIAEAFGAATRRLPCPR